MKLLELLQKQNKERTFFINKIINSPASKKIVISGPGTGKTYLFKRILKNKSGNSLAITFINNLADKLKVELNSLANSCTFHSFCNQILHKIDCKNINKKFIVYPNLDLLIREDLEIIKNKKINFTNILQRYDHDNENLPFYSERCNYYNAVSFNSMVLEVLEYFKINRNRIPRYEQIVVDEFQDFNKLEVEFINMLETKSPILIVGDDDQALYSILKNSSPIFIREKVNDPSYDSFELPYCSRCPRVITDAVEDIIENSKRINKLKDRCDKKYICYLPDKILDCKKYPKILDVHCSVQSKNVPYISKYIKKEIEKLKVNEIKDINKSSDYTILITGPDQYLKQIYSYLDQKENYVIDYRKYDPNKNNIQIIDGYKILIEDDFSNLGWRIILKFNKNTDIDLKDILLKTENNKKIKIRDQLSEDFLSKQIQIIEILKKIKKEETILKSEIEFLEKKFRIKIEKLREKFVDISEEKVSGISKKNSLNKVFIKLSSYVGCKGLSAGYVFILGLNEGSLPKNNMKPTDIEICQFIVAITRTIKCCYLISVDRFAGNRNGERSIFIKWINKERKKYKRISSRYWKN